MLWDKKYCNIKYKTTTEIKRNFCKNYFSLVSFSKLVFALTNIVGRGVGNLEA